MIKITNLAKSFNDLCVLNDINLTIREGSIYGLVGRSGAGKSTLLRCINGLESFDHGSLIVDGQNIQDFNKTQMRFFRKDIGMIFQHFSLLERLDVYDNIALPLRCFKYSKDEVNKIVKKLLDLVGIPEKIHEKPKALSGGQKQRVAIARALSMNPRILLCDEATSALDPKTEKSINDLLLSINKELGITVIVVTHKMTVLKNLCERIAILEEGKIACEGTVEDIFLKQPQSLKNLIGDTTVQLPESGININIEINNGEESLNDPIITKMVRHLNIDFHILGGQLDNYREKQVGMIKINVNKNDYSTITNYLDEHKIKWEEIKRG